jgi:hypothetical protein
MEDAGIDSTGQTQPGVTQELPGAERICVLVVAHEDCADLRTREPKEPAERAQKEDICVAIGDTAIGQERDVDHFEGERAGLAERSQGGTAPEEIRHALVRLGAWDKFESIQARL